MQKFIKVFFLVLISALIAACPVDVSDPPGDDSEQTSGSNSGGTSGGSSGGNTGGNTGGTFVPIAGSDVSQLNNCIATIKGDRFSTSDGLSTAVFISKDVPVQVSSSGDSGISPEATAKLVGRVIDATTLGAYMILQAQNTSSTDYKYVYARPVNFYNAASQRVLYTDSTMRGTNRKASQTSNTCNNVGLAPGDSGLFWYSSPKTISSSDFNSIQQAEITLSLTENNSFTDASSEFTVLGYLFDEVEGELCLTIELKNTGTGRGKLGSATIMLYDDGDFTYFTGNDLIKTPSDGIVDVNEICFYRIKSMYLGNASADEVTIIYNYDDN